MTRHCVHMKYLDYDGADSFYLASIRSYDLRLIGHAELELRLACLIALMDPKDPFRNRLRQTIPPTLAHEMELVDENESAATITRGETSDEQMQRNGVNRDFLPPPVMELVVHGIKGLKKWVFHEFDEDPHPSVPHGHEHGNAHPKCDPYTGFVYDSHRKEVTTERLSRKTRIALWSDPKFREFALKAIIWYESTHPNYVFRVRHPRRLPRFRR